MLSKQIAPWSRLLTLTAAICSAAMIALAITKTWLYYSPVPVWDMWTGFLEFNEKIIGGDRSAWWGQHFEHRIILARLLFWADMHYFHGSGLSVLIINYVNLFSLAFVFWIIVLKLFDKYDFNQSKIIIGIFLSGWLFCSCQGENLTWPFQVEFFLSFLLPLSAFYHLQKFVQSSNSKIFILACAFGILSVGTLAIGVTVLPLMTVYSLIMRQKPKIFFTLFALSASELYLYFHKYTPGNHTIFSQEITNDIFGSILFLLTLIGSPFYYIFGSGAYSINLAQIFGLFFILGVSYKIIKIVKLDGNDPLQLSLIFFILYVSISFIGTTGGRFILGLDAALAFHHTTPAIVGWGTLITLFAVDIAKVLTSKKWLSAPVIILVVMMLNFQAKSLLRFDDVYFDRKVTVLGLSLGAIDDEKLRTLTDPTDFRIIPPIAEKAYNLKLSIFGRYPFRETRERLETVFQQFPLPACEGSLESATPSNDQRFLRISGWLLSSSGGAQPDIARFLTEDGLEVGYALVGQYRPDIVSLTKGIREAGFSGYALSSATGEKLIVRGENRRGPICQKSVMMPDLLFSTKPASVSREEATIDTRAVIPGHQWTGMDFFRTNICGLKVYGSLITGASDVGSISLHLRPGDQILYRSGPSGGQQTLEIEGHPIAALPDAIQWIVLKFSSELPQSGFVAKLMDNGSGWGEWSAIAVRDDASDCH